MTLMFQWAPGQNGSEFLVDSQGGQLRLYPDPAGHQSRLMSTVGPLDQEYGREECHFCGRTSSWIIAMCISSKSAGSAEVEDHFLPGGELRVPQWKNIIPWV
jgi:hypothetical protein